MDYNDLLAEASESIADTPVGSTFFVKELFNGTRWNELAKGDKLDFGKFFKEAATDNRISGVEFIGKAGNNSARYRKI